MAHNPCVDDVNYTIQNCELECFSEAIARHANCCLPFMSLSRTSSNYKNCAMCNSPDDYYRADAELQRMLRNSTPWVGTWRNNFLVFPFSENSTKRSATARVSAFWISCRFHRIRLVAIVRANATQSTTKLISRRLFPTSNQTDSDSGSFSRYFYCTFMYILSRRIFAVRISYLSKLVVSYLYKISAQNRSLFLNLLGLYTNSKFSLAVNERID